MCHVCALRLQWNAEEIMYTWGEAVKNRSELRLWTIYAANPILMQLHLSLQMLLWLIENLLSLSSDKIKKTNLSFFNWEKTWVYWSNYLIHYFWKSFIEFNKIIKYIVYTRREEKKRRPDDVHYPKTKQFWTGRLLESSIRSLVTG